MVQHLTGAPGDHWDVGGLEEHLPRIDAIVEQHGGELISLLQEVQRTFSFLPRDVLAHVARRTGVPIARILGVATFYGSFFLRPRGRRVVRVCQGTACHVRGAHRITEALVDHLSVEPGGTTEDREHTLETVSCIGCCSLAPVMTVGDETFGRLDSKAAVAALAPQDGEAE